MKIGICRRLFYGIQKKIILMVTLILGMLFLISFLGVNWIMQTERYESLSEQYSYLNDKVLNSFEKIRDELDNLTEEFILNEYVQKSLTNQEMTASDHEMMERSLSYYNSSFLDYYLVIDNKGNLYSQREVSLDLEKFQNSVIYESLGEDYSKTKLLWARDVIFGTYEMSFFTIRYVRAMNSLHDPGILILKLNDNLLEGVKKSIEDDRLAYFILDQNQEVCFSRMPGGVEWDPSNEADRVILKETILGEMRDKHHDLDDGIVSSKYDENTGFTIITYAPAEVSHSVIVQIRNVMLLVFLFAYSLAVWAMIVFARRITRPIKMVSATMSTFEESRLDSRIDLNTNTEVDQIGKAYNKMIGSVKNLMEDVQQKECELHESELQSLMYQIRPHFLYNTLDTIYMLARIQKEETIMNMIQSLSRYLRINLSNGNEKIEVNKELEHVRSYLEIQKIRNADLFTYEIEMDPSVSELPVMKMILQPVAENCIKHGFANIEEGGWIRIRAYQEEALIFSVRNNGDVMPEAAREKLNRLEQVPLGEMDQVIQRRQGGYGICNVVKRLRMRYNDRIRFYYLTDEESTECRIEIPLEITEEQNWPEAEE